MRRLLEYGGYAAAVVLVAFGIGALVLSINGKNTVQNDLSQEKIVGSADMTPDAIAAEAQKAGLSGVDFPSCSVAGEPIDTGSEARCFANYMRIHALEASGGKTYAEMPRYATADGKGTNDPAQAQKDANGQPVSNAAHDLLVTRPRSRRAEQRLHGRSAGPLRHRRRDCTDPRRHRGKKSHCSPGRRCARARPQVADRRSPARA